MAALVAKVSISISGVVSGLEGWMVVVVLEVVAGSSAVVSVGVKEVERVGDMVTVTSVILVPAKRWKNEAHKGWR